MSNLVVNCGGVALMLLASMLGLVTPAAKETSKPPPVVESYTIPSGEPGIELFVRNKRPEKVPRISLIGWSRGTALIGMYATPKRDNVQRLVFYAPGWVRHPGSAAAGAATTIGAYQTWTVEQARQRLQTGAPADARDNLMPPRWVEAWSTAVLATDPIGAARAPPVVRTPAGTVQVGREYWQAGKALYDPERITPPTLIVVGDWDGVSPPAVARLQFAKLVNTPIRRFVEIGEATHFMMLEKNRHQLFREVRLFLEEQHIGQ